MLRDLIYRFCFRLKPVLEHGKVAILLEDSLNVTPFDSN